MGWKSLNFDTELWQQTKYLGLLMYYTFNMEQYKNLFFRIGKMFQILKKLVSMDSKVPLPWCQLIFCWVKFVYHSILPRVDFH